MSDVAVIALVAVVLQAIALGIVIGKISRGNDEDTKK